MIADHDIQWLAKPDLKKRKKIGSLNLDPIGLNQAQNEVFHHFIEFGSYDFLEIAYHNSLWQCLTSSLVH